MYGSMECLTTSAVVAYMQYGNETSIHIYSMGMRPVYIFLQYGNETSIHIFTVWEWGQYTHLKTHICVLAGSEFSTLDFTNRTLINIVNLYLQKWIRIFHVPASCLHRGVFTCEPRVRFNLPGSGNHTSCERPPLGQCAHFIPPQQTEDSRWEQTNGAAVHTKLLAMWVRATAPPYPLPLSPSLSLPIARLTQLLGMRVKSCHSYALLTPSLSLSPFSLLLG